MTVLPGTRDGNITWFEARIDSWTSNEVALGFSTTQTANLALAIANARSAYNAYQSLKSDLKNAQIELDMKMNALMPLGRGMILQVKSKAEQAGNYALYATASIPVPAPATKIIPTTPADFTANPSADGSLSLKWKRNGNKQGVIFVIESKTGSGAWEVLAQTTRASAAFTGYTPGAEVSFRVFATKNGVQSPFSNVATIYNGGTLNPLQIAA